MLKDADFQLLAILVASQFDKEPMHVDRLVQRLGVSQSLVSQRLRRLQKEGFLERLSTPTPTGRVVHYRPRPILLVQWVSPGERIALQWQSFDEVNWMFPLVSQVPDAAARFTLLVFLDRLRQENLLLPTSFEHGSKSVPHLGLSLIAYGSCARGSARPGSDLDLISVQDERKHLVDVREQVETLSAEVSLSAPRPIQIKHLPGDELVDLPTGIKSSIQQEGIVVFDGVRSKAGGHARGVFDFVYGGRPHSHL